MAINTAIDRLPSLPQVLVQILEAIQNDRADFQGIAAIIRQDTGLTARLVTVANSSFYGQAKPCTTIERTLLVLGTDLVKTLVITASIKQFYSQFPTGYGQFLRQFWRRSLITANLAQVLATLTSYTSPEEAYLSGLLADVGQLMLLNEHPVKYRSLLEQFATDDALVDAEWEEFTVSHPELGAQLTESWNIGGFIADAIRYQHEPPLMVQDAHHLVKIINVATRLSYSDSLSDATLQATNQLFGFNDALTSELRVRIGDDVSKLAQSLGIDISPDEDPGEQSSRQQLGELLADLGELAQINLGLWQARSRQTLESAIRRSLNLIFSVNDCLLFLRDPQHPVLNAYWNQGRDIDVNKQTPDFTIPIESGRSQVSEAFINNEQNSSDDTARKLSVIDRQLLRLCQGNTLVCCPLAHDEQLIGVLVFGLKKDQVASLENKQGLLFTLTREIAAAISTDRGRFQELNADDTDLTDIKYQIKEAVHEAGNPLSIIRNYLEMLKLKLGEEHEASEGLNLIKEEIDRVGNILLRLKEPDNSSVSGKLDINKIVQQTLQIFSDSIFATKSIVLESDLDPEPIYIDCKIDHLKQILTNLFKNAAEALGPGGKIHVSTERSVSFGGREYSAITIQDNGPGIPDHIKQYLFSPVSSTKGEGHSGLGLSIVKRLIDELNGAIVCRSNPRTGTQFQILLPDGSR